MRDLNEYMSVKFFEGLILNSELRDKFSSYSYSQAFYSAFCNNDFIYQEKISISFSWRTIAGIVADIRNSLFDAQETYLDWYCSGIVSDEEYAAKLVIPEGEITDEIMKDLTSLEIYWVEGDHIPK